MVGKMNFFSTDLLHILFLIVFIISFSFISVDYSNAEEKWTCEEAFVLCMVFEPHFGTKGLYCMAGYLWCIKYVN